MPPRTVDVSDRLARPNASIRQKYGARYFCRWNRLGNEDRRWSTGYSAGGPPFGVDRAGVTEPYRKDPSGDGLRAAREHPGPARPTTNEDLP
ncbi:hypothetical protein ACE1SV_62510 [Streptomyces sp. E-15]